MSIKQESESIIRPFVILKHERKEQPEIQDKPLTDFCPWCERGFISNDAMRQHKSRQCEFKNFDFIKNYKESKKMLDKALEKVKKLEEKDQLQKQELVKKDDEYKKIIDDLISTTSEKKPKKKAMQTKLKVNTKVEASRSFPKNFAAYNFDFNCTQSWAAFLQRYSHMEGIWYCDPAWSGTGCTDYDLMKLKQIRDMPIEHVFMKGVCFMWCLKSAVPAGIDIMRKWGFIYKDMITWEKLDENGQTLSVVGKFLDHSTEVLLLGIKGDPDTFETPIKMHILPDIVKFARPKFQSEKPAIFYQLIKEFKPNSWMLEGFARYPQCLQSDMVAIGNELPEHIVSKLDPVDENQEITKVFLSSLREQKKNIKITSDQVLKEYLSGLAMSK